MGDDERKIFIDEDWKAQVQREKEQAKTAPQEEAAPDGAEEDETSAPEEGKATFGSLIQSLAAQCAFSLGLIAPQDTKQVMVNLDEARYCIDTIVMLRDKTKGNLSKEEEGMLTQTLSELQQIYVVRAQQVQEATLKQAGIDLKNPPQG